MFQRRATSLQPPNRRYSSLSHFLPVISFPVEAFSVVVRRLQVAAFGPTAPLAFLRGPTLYLLISKGLARKSDFWHVFLGIGRINFPPGGYPLSFYALRRSGCLRLPRRGAYADCAERWGP